MTMITITIITIHTLMRITLLGREASAKKFGGVKPT